MSTATPEQEVEAKAREFYEASRRRVSGRPSWENLNPNDPYDMGMRDHAIAKARMWLTADGAPHPVGVFVAQPNPFQHLEDALYAEGDAKEPSTPPSSKATGTPLPTGILPKE